MEIVIILAIAYVAGSIPSAYIAGRLKGVDIRKEGSGNSGATNALRVLGPLAAAASLAVDAGKGVLAVLVIAPSVAGAFGTPGSGSAIETARIAAGAAVVLGHVFPVWLRFKGGKGVATGAAVVACMAPIAAAACLIAFVIVAAISRYVSLASIVAAAVLPVAYAIAYSGDRFSAATLCFFLAASVLVVVMHRKNIARLIAGTEPRINAKH